jgi:Na+/H+ antiporter NhaA
MTETVTPGSAAGGRTVWARGVASQLAGFLRTETGSSGVLVGAIVAAVLWVTFAGASYDAVWSTPVSVHVGSASIGADLRTWITSGLMTLFFLVVGLEARREFDLGALRDRSQFALPFFAGLAGMIVPILIYLAITAGGDGVRGWGAAMSTDTALALGLLALVGRGLPDRIRGFLLTLFIVDDLASLVVIAAAYSSHLSVVPLLTAILAFIVMLLGKRVHAPWPILLGLGVFTWGALFFSGVDPLVSGLAIGLSAPAYTPVRDNLEEATGLFRQFREQPTPELARSASAGLRASLSPNERIENSLHPWTSYVIVPLFALANAGTKVDGQTLRHAFTSSITIGILIAYVVGKPVAVIGMAWVVGIVTRGRVRAPVGWAAVAGSGTIAGVGFTVSLLVATLAFHGELLDEAKIGILAAVIASSLVTWIVFRVTALLPPARRVRALLGKAEQPVDLCAAVDIHRDHVRGDEDATVTVVEYGDFQCPYCGMAEPSVRELREDVGVRFVWRHLPLEDVHPEAALAAEAAEAASAQGAFWEMHDLLLQHQDSLRPPDLSGYAAQLGLDVELFDLSLADRRYKRRVDEDVRSADLSGVSGTPTFFINGHRHYGAYDIVALRISVETAHDVAVARGAV